MNRGQPVVFMLLTSPLEGYTIEVINQSPIEIGPQKNAIGSLAALSPAGICSTTFRTRWGICASKKCIRRGLPQVLVVPAEDALEDVKNVLFFLWVVRLARIFDEHHLHAIVL